MFLSISPPPPFLHSKTVDYSSLPLPSSSFSKPHAIPVRPAALATPSDSHQSKSAIKRISDKLRQLGYVEDNSTAQSKPSSRSAGEIFIPTPMDVPVYRVGSTIDSSWSSPENPVAKPTTPRFKQLWKREEQNKIENRKEESSIPSVAELTIPNKELRRLRGLGIRLTKRLKVGKPGITEGIVNGIHERWRRSEVVKIQCEDLCRINMKRTHETLERKTGGLVIWRSGSILILYRGSNYKYPYFDQTDQNPRTVEPNTNNNSTRTFLQKEPSETSNNNSTRPGLIPGFGSENRVRFQLPAEAKLAEETDVLLNGLGSRFADWWGLDPKPVDGDLLPGLIQGFRKPLRILPFGVKPRLTDSEITVLRRLSRELPCHFALGKNGNLQGLAEAMLKLWEKCEIAKIAVKKGVQNTDSEIMADELKKLTGGTLLSRDSEFIVFCRGKDFLPRSVLNAIEERRKYGNKNIVETREDGDERESTDERGKIDGLESDISDGRENIVGIENRARSVDLGLNKSQSRLSMAVERKERAEKLLEELEMTSEVSNGEHAKETISDEEKYMLRKIGLRMKPFLLLGRRGVFDGTVENMHLHWKYRELVKIIAKDKFENEVENIARILEKESGGILVTVEKVSKGYAIIIYRGTNYTRPKSLRPKSLLTKKEAMERSLEAQRLKALKLHVLNLSENIDELKEEMKKDESLQINHDQIEESKGLTNNDSKEYFEATSNSSSLNTKNESKFEIHSPNLQNSYENDDSNIEIPFKASLSNKERLVLRKQALNMKKKPVLAVGKNNVISGVAKTIKTHFKKHPLAIVNIKNRDEDTPLQQLISELEEATGSVFVSCETNKIILYRGWGARETLSRSKQKDLDNKSNIGENGDSISAELMDALRVECGLEPSNKELS